MQKIKTGESHNDLTIVNTKKTNIIIPTSSMIKKTKETLVCNMILENERIMAEHYMNGDYKSMYEIWNKITQVLRK